LHKLIATMAGTLICGHVAPCQGSKSAIDVSLWSSSANLSAYYQRIVREATEAYIGDFPDGVAVTVRYKRVYHYERDFEERSSLPKLSPELEEDPFSNVSFKLRQPAKSQDSDSASVRLQRSTRD
jgi:hypothetical protein